MEQQSQIPVDFPTIGRKASMTAVQKITIYKSEQKALVPETPEVIPEEVAILSLPGGKKVEIPILIDSLGNPMLDIRNLSGKAEMFTYDPGFVNTASCASKITYIDGNKGQLWYRGYAIEDLAQKCSHLEVCYLLLNGELPDKEEFRKFEDWVKDEMLIHQNLIRFYEGFQEDAHPMAIMTGVVGALSAFMEAEPNDLRDHSWRQQTVIRIIAKMPTIAAYAYRRSIGLPFVQPKRDFSFAQNFLYMMFSDPMSQEFEVHPTIIKAMDLILLLHADHEQNASTSTVRIAGSSLANPYACVAAGIASLWGPAHGGANEAALEMLQEIGTPENIPKYIQKAKDKNDPFRLMGFGHRVYKNFDPRSKIMRELAHEILEVTGKKNDPIFQLAIQLEEIALKDPYFVQRKLYPNVDYYAGIVLNAIGIPKSMFTVIFAVSRSIGWITQWTEMMSDPLFRIGRPRQLYVGNQLKVVPEMNEREPVELSRVPILKKLVWPSYAKK